MKGNLVILSNSLKMHEPKNLLPKESLMDMYKDLAVSCSLLLETNTHHPPDPDNVCVSKHVKQKPACWLFACFKKELAGFYFKMMAS